MDARQTIREFIHSNFYAAGSIGDGDSLIDSGLLDSTGVLEVVAFLEADFGLAVGDDEIVRDNLETIDGIARFVARKLAEDGERRAPAPVPEREAM